MIIKHSMLRRILGMKSWSIQAEWFGELHLPVDQYNNTQASNWTGSKQLYGLKSAVVEWLNSQSDNSYHIENKFYQSYDDFNKGCSPRIWLNSLSQVTHFKLLFGGQNRKDAMNDHLKVTLANIRRVMPTVIANSIVGVSPMVAPTLSIYTMLLRPK